jgi:hypothetical protein
MECTANAAPVALRRKSRREFFGGYSVESLPMIGQDPVSIAVPIHAFLRFDTSKVADAVASRTRKDTRFIPFILRPLLRLQALPVSLPIFAR